MLMVMITIMMAMVLMSMMMMVMILPSCFSILGEVPDCTIAYVPTSCCPVSSDGHDDDDTDDGSENLISDT